MWRVHAMHTTRFEDMRRSNVALRLQTSILEEARRLPANKFDVAASLARFNETCSLKSVLDLAKGFRLKPPEPRPRRSA